MKNSLLQNIVNLLTQRQTNDGQHLKSCAACNSRGYLLSHVYSGNGPLSIVPCYNANCSHTDKYYQELNSRMKSIHEGRDPVQVALEHGQAYRPVEGDELQAWKRLVTPTDPMGEGRKRWPWTPPSAKPYPYLDDQFVDWFKTMKQRDPELQVMIQTDMGSCVVDTLERANDLVSIIKKYHIHEVELIQGENVIPFPIEERFDFQ